MLQIQYELLLLNIVLVQKNFFEVITMWPNFNQIGIFYLNMKNADNKTNTFTYTNGI